MRVSKQFCAMLAVVAAYGFFSENASAQWTNSGGDAILTNTAKGVNIGGAAAPARKLQVIDASNPQIRLGNNAGSDWELWAGSNFHIRTETGTDWIKLDDAGNAVRLGPTSELYVNVAGGVASVGIGTTSPVSTLTVNGTVTPGASCSFDLGSTTRPWRNLYYCGSLISTSDAAAKDNIVDLNYGLSEVLRMRPVSYTLKENPDVGTRLGLIAQEVQPLVGEVVHVPQDGGLLAVSYTELIPVLIKAIQEQQTTITAQQDESNNLRSQLDRQMEQNRNLRQQLEEQANRLSRLEQAMGLSLSGTTEEKEMANTVHITE